MFPFNYFDARWSTELLLELSDLQSQGRLRQMQACGHSRQTADVCNPDEITNLANIQATTTAEKLTRIIAKTLSGDDFRFDWENSLFC
jgi:hypothetical protein